MNLTISIDDELLNRARELARQRGLSLQQLLRDYVRTLVGDMPVESVADELMGLMENHGGRSGNRRIRREEAYKDPT